MSLLGIGSIIEGIGKIADDLFTSDEERLQIALKEKAIDAQLIKGQLDVNVAEAQHKSLFVAGWRPFIGWVGGIALAYQFILYPLMVWGWTWFKSMGWIPADIKAPPVFESGPLFAIVTGMLGIGGMRSFDKLKKTQTDSIK
jgi:hypothetical protein